MAKPYVIRLTTPFERLKIYNTSPDVALFKAIITQAIIDATNTSPKPEAKKIEYEAKNWIFGGSEDFHFICSEARIEPSLVVKITKELIKLHKNKSRLRNNNTVPSKPNPKFYASRFC